MPRSYAVVLIGFLVASLMVVAPDEVTAAYPGSNGRIVFSSDRAGTGTLDLYTMNADGTDVQKLTSSPRADVDATWSPGGTMVAFTRYTASDTDGEIWVISADGTGLSRMTNHPADDLGPTWSADGAKIAWASNRVIGYYDIFTMPAGGGTTTNLTRTHTINEIDPAWSPDRQKIAFVSDRDGIWQLWLMNFNGYGAELLVGYAHGKAVPGSPSWSSDGLYIAFEETDAAEAVSLWAVKPDGTGKTRISATHPSSLVDEGPAFAPEPGPIDPKVTGEIAFSSNIVDLDLTDDIAEFDIFVRSLPSGDQVNLTDSPGADRWPDWQPVPDFPLVDARFSVFDEEIEWVYLNDIVTGCSTERYCPDVYVTRGQMAAFFARAFTLPAATRDYFTDDESSPFEAEINLLAESGITTGCAPSLFCPTALVSRQHMASLLVRARGLTPSPWDFFTDDETSPHEADINSLAWFGPAYGCQPTLYCPRAFVTRGQMAAFFYRSFTWPPPD